MRDKEDDGNERSRDAVMDSDSRNRLRKAGQ